MSLTPLIPFLKLIEIAHELNNIESFEEKIPAKTNRLLRRASSQRHINFKFWICG